MPDNSLAWAYGLQILGVIAAILTIAGTGYLMRNWLMRVLHIPLPIHGLQRSMCKEIPGFNATLRRHYVRYGGSKPGRSRKCYVFVHDQGMRTDEGVTLAIESTAPSQFKASICRTGEEANTILEGQRVRDSEGRCWETRTTPGATPQRKTAEEVCWETLERLLKEAGGEQQQQIDVCKT